MGDSRVYKGIDKFLISLKLKGMGLRVRYLFYKRINFFFIFFYEIKVNYK